MRVADITSEERDESESHENSIRSEEGKIPMGMERVESGRLLSGTADKKVSLSNLGEGRVTTFVRMIL